MEEPKAKKKTAPKQERVLKSNIALVGFDYNNAGTVPSKEWVDAWNAHLDKVFNEDENHKRPTLKDITVPKSEYGK